MTNMIKDSHKVIINEQDCGTIDYVIDDDMKIYFLNDFTIRSIQACIIVIAARIQLGEPLSGDLVNSSMQAQIQATEIIINQIKAKYN